MDGFAWLPAVTATGGTGMTNHFLSDRKRLQDLQVGLPWMAAIQATGSTGMTDHM